MIVSKKITPTHAVPYCFLAQDVHKVGPYKRYKVYKWSYEAPINGQKESMGLPEVISLITGFPGPTLQLRGCHLPISKLRDIGIFLDSLRRSHIIHSFFPANMPQEQMMKKKTKKTRSMGIEHVDSRHVVFFVRCFLCVCDCFLFWTGSH